MTNTCKYTFIVMLAAACGHVAKADVVNGTFDSDLASWTADGMAQVVTFEGNKFVGLEEPGTGSRSRIYQTAAAPVTPTWLSFRYRLAYAPDTRPAALPPDSFSAFLLDGNGDRVVLGRVAHVLRTWGSR